MLCFIMLFFFMIKQQIFIVIFFNEVYNEYFKNDFKLLLFELQI
jgi:hypothetical protein